MAASRKQDKYYALAESYVFQPIALKTLGAINESPVQFLHDLRHEITSVSVEVSASWALLSCSLSLLLSIFWFLLFEQIKI